MSAEAMPMPKPRLTSEQRKLRFVNNAMSVLSALGMLDSGYLTIMHYRGLAKNACHGLGGCERVLTSWWAHPFFNIPTSLYGFVFYAAVFLMLGWNAPPKRLLALSAPAFCIHLFFVYVQAFILHAFCPFCLVSFALTTVLFLLSIAYVTASASRDK